MNDDTTQNPQQTSTSEQPESPKPAADPIVIAEHFKMSYTYIPTSRFDQNLAKQYLTTEQIAACYVDGGYAKYSTVRNDKAKKPKFTPPNLSNVTLTGAIDILGDIREKKAELKKLEGLYKGWIATLRGETYTASIEDDEDEDSPKVY